MNTAANYKIGDAVTLTETGLAPKWSDHKGKPKRYVRHGVVVDISDRIRVKWGRYELFYGADLVNSGEDGKRTWVAANRLKIVTPA